MMSFTVYKTKNNCNDYTLRGRKRKMSVFIKTSKLESFEKTEVRRRFDVCGIKNRLQL